MKVLLFGGTGAIGRNLTTLLLKRGHSVYITSRSPRNEKLPGLHYYQGDAACDSFVLDILKFDFDVVIDFIVRPSKGFENLASVILNSCRQYIFVSSYRANADDCCLTESSPLLVDVCTDDEYLKTREYALEKGRCERILSELSNTNWTIVRPAITYDKSGRFQFGCLESNVWLWRAKMGFSVPMPEEMLEKFTTLTSGEDVALMIEGLVGNTATYGQVYLAASSESIKWGEVCDIYKSVIPFNLVNCSLGEYERVTLAEYQIKYDRMLDRKVDNSLILTTCGLTQQRLTPVALGLDAALREYLKKDFAIFPSIGTNARIDRLVGERSLKLMNVDGSVRNVMKYCYGLMRH